MIYRILCIFWRFLAQRTENTFLVPEKYHDSVIFLVETKVDFLLFYLLEQGKVFLMDPGTCTNLKTITF